jgi:hypothetical protein
MNYSMTEPCEACPFLKDSGFNFKALVAHASGEFACHKTCNLSDKSGNYEPHKKSLHCAGALIFNEKRNAPHQMMRICERLGMYDARKLNMNAPVGSKANDFKRARG